MLEINIQEKRYDEILFRNIHLLFLDHGMIGISSESGKGKSTLLNIIADLDTQYKGRILFNQQSLKELQLEKCISYVFSTNYLLNNMTAKKYLELVNHCNYSYYNELLDFDLELTISSLSRGQMQRLSLVFAMIKNLPVLLLDEVISGQDEMHARKMLEVIHDFSCNHLVILVSHDINLMEEYCDEIIELKSNLEYIQKGNEVSLSARITRTIHLRKIVSGYCRKENIILFFSLFSVCMMLSLLYFCSSSLAGKMIEAIEDYFPKCAYSFHGIDLEYSDFVDYYTDCQVYFCIDDYELAGIETNYENLYQVDDYIQEVKDLIQGNVPKLRNEIVIGEEVSENLNIEIGQTVTLVYMHDYQKIPVKYLVCGIEKGNEISFLEGGELSYLDQLYGVHCSYVIISCEDEKVINRLLEKETRPYLKVGENIIEKVRTMTKKVKQAIETGGLFCLIIALYAILLQLDQNVQENKRIIGFLYLNMISARQVFVNYFLIYFKCLILAVLSVNGFWQGIIGAIEFFLNKKLHLLGIEYYLIYGIITLLWSLMVIVKYGSVLHLSKMKLLKKIK